MLAKINAKLFGEEDTPREREKQSYEHDMLQINKWLSKLYH